MRWWCGWLTVVAVSVALAAPSARAAATGGPAIVLFDATTGQILREQDGESVRAAGSLYQLMVMLLTLEQADLGTMRLDVPVTVGEIRPEVPAKSSARAAKPHSAAGPLGLHPQRPYLLSDLLKAIAVIGSDEATVAVAEAISGSSSASLEAMNDRAQLMGLTATHFEVLANAAPGKRGGNRTSARDVARLAHALLGHRNVSEWTTLNGLPFDDGGVLLRNSNPLLGTVPGVDGLHVGTALSPTGGAPGYHAVISATRGDLRLVAVVLDAPDSNTRFRSAVDLLDWGFARYERVEVVKRGERINLRVEVDGGASSSLTPIAGDTFSVLRQRGEERNFQLRYQVPSTVIAPVERQQAVGEIIIEEQGQVVAVIPALSPATVPAIGVLSASAR